MAAQLHSSSYVVDIYNVDGPTINDASADTEEWSKITMGNNQQAEWDAFDMQAYSKAGLFSFDLSAFIADCEISQYCNNDTYASYDGSAIGQMWYIDSAASLKASGSTWISENHEIFTCFSGTKGCTGLQMVYSDADTYGHLLMTAAYSGSLSRSNP